MSTKIFNGYRLREGTDIWAFTERLREQGNELRDRLDMEAIEQIAEGDARERRKEGKPPITERTQYLMKGYHGWAELMRSLGESRLSDPHQLSVTFIRDPETNRILALLYAGSKMESVFTDQPEVEEWGYWNNSDEPEGMKQKDWLEREETWSRVLGMDPPVRRGISFDLRADMTDGIVELIYGIKE